MSLKKKSQNKKEKEDKGIKINKFDSSQDSSQNTQKLNIKVVKGSTRKTYGKIILAIFIALLLALLVLFLYQFGHTEKNITAEKIANDLNNANNANDVLGSSNNAQNAQNRQISDAARAAEKQIESYNSSINGIQTNQDDLNLEKSNELSKNDKSRIIPNDKKIPTFSNYAQFDADGTNAIHAVDIDKDGYVDVITGNDAAKAKLYLNTGKGFSKVYEFSMMKVIAIDSADYNNDGSIDVALGVSDDNNYIFYQKKYNQYERETLPSIITLGKITDITSADYDNDGKIDIASSTDNDGNYIYLNKGNNRFIKAPMLSQKHTQQIVFADFDNDGWPDILTANYNQDSYIYYNRATKFAKLFDEVSLTNETGNFIRKVAVCDINNDGALDIVSANYDQKDMVFFNKANRTFQKQEAFGLGNAVDVACADFNNDGWNDVVIINYNEPSFIYLNNKTNFVKISLDIPSSISVIDIADFNNDNYLDLAIGRRIGKSEIWINNLGKSK